MPSIPPIDLGGGADGGGADGFTAFMQGISDKAPPIAPATIPQSGNTKYIVIGGFLVLAISMIGIFSLIKTSQ